MKRSSKSRCVTLVYEASGLGENGEVGFDWSSCERGPRESLTEGGDGDGFSRRRIESAVLESDVH